MLRKNTSFQTNLLPLVGAEVWLEISPLHAFPVYEFTYFFYAAEKQWIDANIVSIEDFL